MSPVAGSSVLGTTPSPPGGPIGAIARPALLRRLDAATRVGLVVAPPGFGKTELARQWLATVEGPSAWLGLDLLDDRPATFWARFVETVRGLVPDVDDEPALLLAERGPTDAVFLGALTEQVLRLGAGGSVVVDDLWRVGDRSVHDGLAYVVSRAGHLLRLVLVSRSDPPLPTAAWRSRGWLTEIRAEHLRFTDDEAVRAAGAFGGLRLDDGAAVALNQRAEGWPIGLHLVLLTLAEEAESDRMAAALTSSDRLLADYLVAEVLDRLPDDEREAALTLSVLPWFDGELVTGLLGPAAGAIAERLRRRGLFLTRIDERGDALRFHRLIRELLESELRWRDPDGRQAAHRRAAELWLARGDGTAAYHHLVAVGDVAAASALLVPLALDLVDRGDLSGLDQHLLSLPASLEVTDPQTAIDVSMAAFFAGHRDEAVRWGARAGVLADAADDRSRRRVRAGQAVLALMQGAFTEAAAHAESFEQLGGAGGDGPLEERFATVGARIALAAGDHATAYRYVDDARQISEPAVITHVTVPAIDAALALETGEVTRARELADRAVAEAERIGIRPHHGAMDALITATGCRLAAGQLREADALLERARQDVIELDWPLHRVRVGLLGVELMRLRDGDRAGLAAVEDLRAALDDPPTVELERWLDHSEALGLIGCGRFHRAAACLDRLDDGPRTQLLRARLAVSKRGHGRRRRAAGGAPRVDDGGVPRGRGAAGTGPRGSTGRRRAA